MQSNLDPLITAYSAKPKVYHLAHSLNPELIKRGLKFYALGCGGDAKTRQLQVAKHMNQIASNPANLPDFILLLGDNFYDDGVKSANDEIFKTHFYDIYSNPAFKTLRKIPFFVIQGNHDQNRHSANFFGDSGVSVGMYQVAQTYTSTERITTEKLQEIYNQDQLDLDTLPKLWNMPSRFYALVYGDTQIFCIDSNTYVSDFLKICNGDTNRNNQAYWLWEGVKKAKAADRKIILASHHPLVTQCKRAFQDDTHLYLTSEELNSPTFIDHFKHIMEKKTASYNQLLRETFVKQNLSFDAIVVAHDHNMSYYNNQKIKQIGSGGGGGSLQNRIDTSEQSHTGCFIDRNGFTDIWCEPGKNKPISVVFSSIPNSPEDLSFTLQFKTQSCAPVFYYPSDMTTDDITKIQVFRSVVISAVNAYLKDFLADHQTQTSGGFLGINPMKGGNISHGSKGVERAHTIWNYVNNCMVNSYAKMIETIYNLSRWNAMMTKPSTNSFITLLNNQIAMVYGPNENMETLNSASQKRCLRLS
jgi:hypothetical protein